MNIVEPVRTDTIETFPEQIAAKLEADICDGVFRPGQRLAPRSVGQLYGASGRSVSRAFHLLAPRGYVTIRPNSGVFVARHGAART